MNAKFTQLLLEWHTTINKRSMPWKGEKDAYKIWLSEIILQQTRVEQGLAYYEKFVTQFPTITQLANAKDEVVFKLWEGLGYYSRCNNLLATARFIAKELHGIFPNNYASILQLKGVGPYTAAAIASFAYNLPYAVVDGNVFRVLARFFNIATPIDSTAGKKKFTALANELIDIKKPALYNQAIMDFGATVCKPVAPLCNQCVVQHYCAAFKKNTVEKLPIKEKMLVKKVRYFYYYILQYQQFTWVQQRTAKDIWQYLHEYYLQETNAPIQQNEKLVASFLQKNFGVTGKNIAISAPCKQQLTHQTIIGQFIKVQLLSKPTLLANGEWLTNKKVKEIAFPKFINQYFQLTEEQINIPF